MMTYTPARYPMVADEATRTIRVNDQIFARPDLSRRSEWDTELKQRICPLPIDIERHPKVLNKYFAEMLGPKFNRRFYAANYWMWIGNRMTQRTGNMLKHDGQYWRYYDSGLVETANRLLPYINEAERDNLYHLIPIILVFKDTPQEIRASIGRGAWRRVANNSVSRNLLIMHAARRTYGQQFSIESFMRLIDLPSGVMRGIRGHVDEAAVIAARITPRKRPHDFSATLNLVADTKNMIPLSFNPQWGLARMRREHDAAVKDMMLGKFSDKPFRDAWSFTKDGYTATLLVSQAEIATEGAVQRHCVAMYAAAAAAGDYAVFRIEGKERATAGVWLNPKHGPAGAIDQIYAAYNQPASTECARFMVWTVSEYIRPTPTESGIREFIKSRVA